MISVLGNCSNIYDKKIYDPKKFKVVASYDNGLLSSEPEYLAHYLMRRNQYYMVYVSGGPDCWLSADGRKVRLIRPMTAQDAWDWLRQNKSNLHRIVKDEWIDLFVWYVLGAIK